MSYRIRYNNCICNKTDDTINYSKLIEFKSVIEIKNLKAGILSFNLKLNNFNGILIFYNNAHIYYNTDCKLEFYLNTNEKIKIVPSSIIINSNSSISIDNIYVDECNFIEKQYKDFSNILFTVLICDKTEYYIDRLKNLTKKFNNCAFNYILIKGDSDETYYDENNKILNVKCYDIYENLSLKMAMAYKWIYDNTNYDFIYKIDDDHNFNKYKIPHNYEDYDYYGNEICVKKFYTKSWHFGKCHSDELNTTLCSDEFIHKYANGGFGYILSRHAIKILLDNYDELITKLYEDKAVGDILYKNKIIINKNKYYN